MKKRKAFEVVLCSRWRYEYYPPCAKLKDFVACYCSISSRGKEAGLRATRFVPDGKMDLLFEFRPKPPRRAGLKGLMHNSFFIRRMGKVEFLTVKLQPGAFYSLFHLPSHRFSESFMPLNSAIGRKAGLFEGVFSGENVQARIRILESVLEKLALTAKTPDPRIKLAVDIINNGKDDEVRIGELSRVLKISENQLMVMFKKWVGTTPKRFCRIIRFARVRFNMWTRPRASLLDLALDEGYYDQAHFSHEFKRLYGMAPSQLRLRELRYLLERGKKGFNRSRQAALKTRFPDKERAARPG